MTTLNPRINLTLDLLTYQTIRNQAKLANTSLSNICLNYIKKQIEEDEDIYWNKIISERKATLKNTISHEEVWG